MSRADWHALSFFRFPGVICSVAWRTISALWRRPTQTASLTPCGLSCSVIWAPWCPTSRSAGRRTYLSSRDICCNDYAARRGASTSNAYAPCLRPVVRTVNACLAEPSKLRSACVLNGQSASQHSCERNCSFSTCQIETRRTLTIIAILTPIARVTSTATLTAVVILASHPAAGAVVLGAVHGE